MKILALSDTHYRINDAVSAVKRHLPELILHMGDMTDDADEIKRLFPDIELINVRGNCDYKSNSPLYRTFKIENRNFFITHGHTYDVKYGYMKIAYAAEERNADICLFGHSHTAYADKLGRTVLLNSGSISLPRNTSLGTYALIETQSDKINIKIYYTDGNVYIEREYYDDK